MASLLGYQPVFGQWAFTRVADSQTSLPTVPPHTTNFFQYPSGTGGHATFGSGPPGSDSDGLYTDRSGVLTLIAQPGNAAPDGGTFSRFGIPSSDGTSTAFRASTTLTSGVYREDSGAISVVANRSTTVPGTSSLFSSFDQPVIDGAAVAFDASGGGRSGIYTSRSGLLNVVADTTTPVPGGGGVFSNLLQPVMRASDLVFYGSNATERSIIRSSNGALSVVADIRTPVPGSAGTFSNLAWPSTDGSNVAFVGGPTGSVNTGVYMNVGGQVIKIADQSTALPGAGLFLDAIGPVSTWGGAVVFVANATAGEGLYYWRGGQIAKIIGFGDTINGHPVSYLRLTSESLYQDAVSFWMAEPGQLPQAIYTGTLVPAPGAAFVLAGAGLLATRRRAGT